MLSFLASSSMVAEPLPSRFFNSMGIELTDENIIEWGVSKFDDWRVWDGFLYFGETTLHEEH